MLGGNVKIRAGSGGLNENDSGFKGEVLIEEEGKQGVLFFQPVSGLFDLIIGPSRQAGC